jgi:hypothetical protein
LLLVISPFPCDLLELSVTVAAVRSLREAGPLDPWVWQALAWSAGIFVAFFLVAVHLYRNTTA